MSSNGRGNFLTVVPTSFATYTTCPIINFCPAETSPHTGSDRIVMNAERGATKNSSSLFKSNSGGLSGNPTLFFFDNLGMRPS